jgi:L-alanine-DL-glutamate epimerase-like enolase superfamily enzyme
MEGGRKLEGPLGNVLTRTPLRVENGAAFAPAGPGLGIEWNDAALARVTVGDA